MLLTVLTSMDASHPLLVSVYNVPTELPLSEGCFLGFLNLVQIDVSWFHSVFSPHVLLYSNTVNLWMVCGSTNWSWPGALEGIL